MGVNEDMCKASHVSSEKYCFKQRRTTLKTAHKFFRITALTLTLVTKLVAYSEADENSQCKIYEVLQVMGRRLILRCSCLFLSWHAYTGGQQARN